MEQVESVLDEVTDASVWSMDPEETAATLVRLTATVARLSELELRVAAHADSIGIGESSGATSTANWWAHQTRQTRTDARRKVALGAALAYGHDCTRTALAAGDMTVEQARVIVQAVDRLPADADQENAERHLVAEAAHHDPRALRLLGKRLLEVVAPDVADAHEAKLLEREEQLAEASCRLTMTDRGDGTTHGTFTLPTLTAEAWKKALLAIAAPRHRAATDGSLGERRPGPERMGRALCEYIERYPVDRLPDAGGLAATVVVTMTLETLMGGLKATQRDTGARISPGAARRMACEAGIIPVVLGGRSEVLDVGRRRLPLQGDADRDDAPRRRVHHRGLRLATGHVP